MDWLNGIGDKIFTEAGVLAFVLFWWCVYLCWKNNDLEKYSRKLNKHLYDLGMAQTIATSEVGAVLDKLVGMLQKRDKDVRSTKEN